MTERKPLILTNRDRDLIARLTATEAAHALRESDPEEYKKQVYGIVDVVLNRAASGKFGGHTISGVANAPNQFSAINGPRDRRYKVWGAVENVPDDVVPDYLRQIIDDHLDARMNGQPSSVGGATHYANPLFSDGVNLSWINKLDGPVFGAGNMIHRHGNAFGAKPVEAVLIPAQNDSTPRVTYARDTDLPPPPASGGEKAPQTAALEADAPKIDGFYHIETWKDNPGAVLQEKQDLKQRDKSVGEIQAQLKELGYNLGPFKDKNGNRTGIDGRFGKKTRAAVEAFQREWNAAHPDQTIAVSGKLDAQTRIALNLAQKEKEEGKWKQAAVSMDAHDHDRDHSVVLSTGNGSFEGPVTAQIKESDGLKLYSDKDLHFATPGTAEALEEIAKEFKRVTGKDIMVGDVSKYGGGDITGHKTHENGCNVDIRPEAIDGNGPTRVGAENYDAAMTRQLVAIIKEKYPAAKILFNDGDLVRDRLTTPCAGHDNHLHVIFNG